MFAEPDPVTLVGLCAARTGYYHGEVWVCTVRVGSGGRHRGDHVDGRYAEVAWPNRDPLREELPVDAAKTWWHVARTPGGVKVHRLDSQVWQNAAAATGHDDPATAAAQVAGDMVEAIRSYLGFPPGWEADPRWGSALHKQLPRDATAEDVVLGLWPEPYESDR